MMRDDTDFALLTLLLLCIALLIAWWWRKPARVAVLLVPAIQTAPLTVPRPARPLAIWVYDSEEVNKLFAQELIRYSAVWDHSSGAFVNTPRHAERVKHINLHGWALEFGVSHFLPGNALLRSRKPLIEASMNPDVAAREVALKEKLKEILLDCVLNKLGYECRFPDKNGKLMFGNQGIDLDLAVECIIKLSGLRRMAPFSQAVR